MTPRQRRKPNPEPAVEEKPDRASEDTLPASDSVAFIEPASEQPNDTPLDKDREQNR